MLYNGKEHIGNETELRLSDAYMDSKESNKERIKNVISKTRKTSENNIDKEEEHSLQLVVKVININWHAKADILHKWLKIAATVSSVEEFKIIVEE